jgi:pimeloyl-ACP methyl ester carboxylesterase
MARVAGRGLAAPVRARERESLVRRDSWVGALMAWTPARLEGPLRVVETEDFARRGFGRAWAEVAAQADVVRVPGAHAGLILDHGEEVAAAMRRWLEPAP